MSTGRQLRLWEQERQPSRHTPFRIVVYRSAPAGAEVFLVRVGRRWSLPGGTCRPAETPNEASERYLRRRWGSRLATADVDGDGALFAAEAEAADSGLFEPIAGGGEWFGLGKVRALRLGPDEAAIARLLESLD
jgi:8-oxo-dGTP pyrophosphatase MutT (NUDIX family)